MSSIGSEIDFSDIMNSSQELDAADLHSSYNASISSANESSDSIFFPNKLSLLQLLQEKKLLPKDISQIWINIYRESPAEALIKLMQFVLEAAGSQFQIPESLDLPFNNSDILTAATNQFGNKGLSYPLSMKSADMFASSIGSFIQQLMRFSNIAGITVDPVFIENICSFLLLCTESNVRAFRHTASLIVLKMMTVISTVENLKYEVVKDNWLKLYATVFLERKNDALEEIRCLCLAECGKWLDKVPECVLTPQEVRHLFDAIQDNAPSVCKISFRALLNLSNNIQMQAACLQMGTQNRAILIGLTMSSESEVAEIAVQLLVKYFWAKPDILDESMRQVIEQLIFASKRGVAQAAVDLIPFRYREATSPKDRMRIVVQFFIDFGQHEHAAYFVDAFYGCNDMILDWSTMVSMLLKPESLTLEETSALIDIMTLAVKQAVTGEVPAGRYTEDAVRQPTKNAKNMAASIILPHLYKLLRQYRNRIPDLTNLMELPQYMNLGGASFESLMEQIRDIMFDQENDTVLKMGAKTLEYICSANSNYSNYCKELLNNAVTNYIIAAKVWIDSSNGAAKNVVQGSSRRFLMTLRLLSAFYSHFDLNEWHLIDNILSILQKASKDQDKAIENPVPIEALCLYLNVVYVAFCWDVKRIQAMARDSRDTVALVDGCLTLGNRLTSFLSVCFSLIEQNVYISAACKAFVHSCDLFILFADPLRSSHSAAVREMEYKSNINEYEILENFLMVYVFEGTAAELMGPEMSFMLDNKRRVLTSYLKLIFFNVVPMMRGSIVFQYYDRFFLVYGDIINATLQRCIRINPTNFGMTVMHTCLLVYQEVRMTYEDVALAAASPEFARLLNLCRLLAKQFNVRQLYVRQGIVVLHRAGIRFAAGRANEIPTGAPKDLLFLTVMQQFVSPMLAQDMMEMLMFIRFIDHEVLPTSSVEEWEPLQSYRGALEIALRQSCRRDELNDFFEQT